MVQFFWRISGRGQLKQGRELPVKKLLRGWGLLALCLLVPGLGQAAQPVRLVIEDNAGLFSEKARESARQQLSALTAKVDREVHLKTYSELSPDLQAKMATAGNDAAKKAQVWSEFTSSHLRGERGVVILIVKKPGHVDVKADKAMTQAGFEQSRSRKVREVLVKGLDDASRVKEEPARQDKFDDALALVTTELRQSLPLEKAKAAVNPIIANLQRPPAVKKEAEENNLFFWIIVGLGGLLVVWLLVGLMRGLGRAMGGGGAGAGYGGGGGGPMGGGYGGGGGGGGGFMTNMLGGMFGAAAGMWMYNHFLGSGTPGASAGGLYGGDNATGGDEAGAGDFSGDNSSSGDFGDTASGGDAGGDWGGNADTGGSSDWGGGGDSGGGGGDWGGGGE